MAKPEKKKKENKNMTYTTAAGNIINPCFILLLITLHV